MFYIIIILWISAFSYQNCFQIHDDLTDEEIMTTFHVSRDSVPEYDVVQVAHTLDTKQDKPEISLRAFNKDLRLYLEPNSHLLIGKDTPIYLTYKCNSDISGVRYIKQKHNLDFKTFYNINNKAVIMAHKKEDGYIDCHGTIEDDILIRPIPSQIENKIRNRIENELYRYPRYNFNKFKYDYGNIYNYQTDYWNSPYRSRWIRSIANDDFQMKYHIVLKLPKRKDNNSLVNKLNRTLKKINFRKGLYKRSKRDVVDNVYPEILVTSDYETFESHGKNVEEFIKYMVVFWNGVDLRFRSVKSPRIHLNVAGIIIPQELDAVPYLQSSRMGKNQLLAEIAVPAIGSYFYNQKIFPKDSYDVVISLTK